MGIRPHNLTLACLAQASYAKGRAFAAPESVLPRNRILCSNRSSAYLSLTSRLHLARSSRKCGYEGTWTTEMGEWLKGEWVKGMVSALWVMRGRPDAAASLPPRPGADGSRVCVCFGSFCSSQEFAEERVVELVSASPRAR